MLVYFYKQIQLTSASSNCKLCSPCLWARRRPRGPRGARGRPRAAGVQRHASMGKELELWMDGIWESRILICFKTLYWIPFMLFGALSFQAPPLVLQGDCCHGSEQPVSSWTRLKWRAATIVMQRQNGLPKYNSCFLLVVSCLLFVNCLFCYLFFDVCLTVTCCWSVHLPNPSPVSTNRTCNASRVEPRWALRWARRASRASCTAAAPSSGSTSSQRSRRSSNTLRANQMNEKRAKNRGGFWDRNPESLVKIEMVVGLLVQKWYLWICR